MKTDTTVALGMWRPVTARLRDWLQAVPRLEHFSTSRFRRRHGGLEQGESIWSVSDDEPSIAIYFNWAEISTGVLALVDPMAAFSNVRLLDERGRLLPSDMSTVHINQALYEIDWRSPVCERLDEWRQAVPEAGLPMPKGQRRRQLMACRGDQALQGLMAA